MSKSSNIVLEHRNLLNWEVERSKHHILYVAALDAYCLIVVYEVLAHECINQGVPFQDVCQDLMIAGANVTKKPKKKPLPSRKVWAICSNYKCTSVLESANYLI